MSWLSIIEAIAGALKTALAFIGDLLLMRAGADRAKRKQAEAENANRKKQARAAAAVSGLSVDDLADRVRKQGF